MDIYLSYYFLSHVHQGKINISDGDKISRSFIFYLGSKVIVQELIIAWLRLTSVGDQTF